MSYGLDPQDGIAMYDRVSGVDLRQELQFRSDANVLTHGGTIMSSDGIEMINGPQKGGRREFLAERVEMSLRRAEEYQALLENLDRFGEDNWPDDTVLSFTFQFKGNGTAYSYLAYKIKGHWYLSGKVGAKMTWNELIEWWSDGVLGPMFVATEWTPVEF